MIDDRPRRGASSCSVLSIENELGDVRMKYATLAILIALGGSTSAMARTGNEVPLHIEAVGEVAPDTATIGLTQQATASSQAGANSALDRQHADLVRLLGGYGIGAGDITWTRDATQSPSSADAMMESTDSPAGAKSSPQTYYSSATALITLHDTTKLPAMMTAGAALPDAPTVSAKSVHYSFADERAARALAIQRGFAIARRDADNYATAAQMKIARIERISSARSPFSATDMQQFIAKFVGMIDSKAFPGDAFSSVTAAVVVDYVLVP